VEAGVWAARTKENYWEKPYVLTYNAAQRVQEAYYLVHVLGRNQTSRLNFDVYIPGLDTNQLLLEPVNGTGVITGDFNGIPWTEPQTQWAWIIDYVRLNRVEQHFAAALEALGSMALHPCWSSMEACAWQEAELRLVLANFSPTRARIKGVLEGVAYEPETNGPAFPMSEAGIPENFIAASGILNYYMWYGLYSLYHNEARSRDDWRTVFGSLYEELGITATAHMRPAAVSLVTGKEFPTAMTEGCGVSIDTSYLYRMDKITQIRDLDGSIGAEVKIDAIYAPVSGSIILGAVACSLETTAHLQAVQVFKGLGRSNPRYDFEQKVIVANIYRLFGHEVTFRDSLNGNEKQSWAPVRECIVEPASIEFETNLAHTWEPHESSRREGRSHVLPQLRTVLDGQILNISISKPNVSLMKWQSRVVKIRPVVRLTRVKKPVEFKINTSLTPRPAIFAARRVHNVPGQHFRMDAAELPPRLPEGPVVQAHPPADPGGGGVAAALVLPPQQAAQQAGPAGVE